MLQPFTAHSYSGDGAVCSNGRMATDMFSCNVRAFRGFHQKIFKFHNEASLNSEVAFTGMDLTTSI